VNYEWLFSFVTFADKLNFTHAAAELHISQPALHVQIRKLAEEVGRPLYRKHGRSLALSEEGKRLAAYGRSIQEQERDMLGELRGETLGPVVLASGQGAFMHMLGPAIKRFPKERWPLRLLTLRGPETIEAVRDARAHLGVAVLGTQPKDLQVTKVRSVGQVAVMPRSHPLGKRRRLSAGDLHQHALVVAPAGSPHRVMLEHAMKADNATLVVGVEAMGWELMLEFARDGMGIAVVNDFCPVPRGCVGVALRALPRSDYSIVHRKTSNPGVLRLKELICESQE
jgi:DNA-binding transcriptional LysR family regulator